MRFGDGTQFGFSEPQGAGVTVSLIAVYGIPGVTQYTAGQVPTVVTFTPGLAPVGP